MSRRILLLSDVNSPHTVKIVNGLCTAGFSMGIFSLTKKEKNIVLNPGVEIFDALSFEKEVIRGKISGKLSYLRTVRSLKKIIAEFKPGIVHAHYATSYGLLGKLSGFHPLVISAWGSDVLDFPKTTIKRLVLKRILLSADQLMCTSRTLAAEVKRISGRDSVCTPFGIDTNEFFPCQTESFFPEGTIVFGTVKSLEKVYGTDILLRAFVELKKESSLPIGLLLVGDGAMKAELAELAEKSGVAECVKFTGRINHDDIPRHHNAIDIFMNLSRYESFGVSVLEAMACSKPVIVSDTGGLAEIVSKGLDGIKVPAEDVHKAAAAMKKLLEDESLRKRMGENGRKKVVEHFEWKKTVELIAGSYNELLKQRK